MIENNLLSYSVIMSKIVTQIEGRIESRIEGQIEIKTIIKVNPKIVTENSSAPLISISSVWEPSQPSISNQSNISDQISLTKVLGLVKLSKKCYNDINYYHNNLLSALYKNLYPTIHLTSIKLIDSIDKFIVIFRKMRRVMLSVGFIKLRKFGLTQNIINLVIQIGNIEDMLVEISTTDYSHIKDTPFYEWVIRGENILTEYINKFNNLISISEKWAKKFYI